MVGLTRRCLQSTGKGNILEFKENQMKKHKRIWVVVSRDVPFYYTDKLEAEQQCTDIFDFVGKVVEPIEYALVEKDLTK